MAAWKRDGEADPTKTRFVFAYTNKDVDALNTELRQVRRERGELTGRDVALETKHGRAAFAVGDRVQFTDTDKKLRIYNGNVGTITRLDPSTGTITATLDAAGREGREVTWTAAEFEGFRHGHAGTIYKGQGKTLDRTYIYHTEHWRSAASYVALTRQRESAEVFVARETARDAGQLARQMARGEVRSASLAWATRGELGAEQNRAAEREEQARRLHDGLTWSTRQGGNLDQVRAVLSPAARDFLDAMGDKIDRDMVRLTDAERAQVKLHGARELAEKEIREGPVDPAYARRQAAEWAREGQEAERARGAEKERQTERAPAPLLPAWRDPTGQGHDSLGRGLDGRSIVAAVLADGAVKREREALGHYLQGAYRDPAAAHAAIGAVVQREGWYQAGKEIARDPAQFGELRGKTGWFASAASKEERAGAERASRVVPDSLRRIHETTEAARRAYVQEVQTQQNRDATEIPGLSKAALTVLRNTREARLMGEIQREGEDYDARARRREEMVAAAWQKGRADPRVAGELDRFMLAASQRLGPEGEQAALRAAASGRTMELPGVGREHRAGLDELARHFAETREAVTLSARWEHRAEREAKEAERWQARQQDGSAGDRRASRSRTVSGRGASAGWTWEVSRRRRFLTCLDSGDSFTNQHGRYDGWQGGANRRPRAPRRWPSRTALRQLYGRRPTSCAATWMRLSTSTSPSVSFS